MLRRAFARPGLLPGIFLAVATVFLVGRPERGCRSCVLPLPAPASEPPSPSAPAPSTTIFTWDASTSQWVATIDHASGQRWLRGERLEGVKIEVVPVDHWPR